MYFPSAKEEYIEPREAAVTGTVPQWLEGSLYRNGPGTFEIGDCRFNHLFDGMGKINKFTIRGGRVTFQSRFVQSTTYKKNTAANRIVVSEFGTLEIPDPCKSKFSRMMSRFELPKAEEMTDNTVVNVFPVGDALFATTETNIIHRVDWRTLDTMKAIDISKLVAVNSATAHPHLEPDGTIYNLGMMHKEGKYAIIKLKPAAIQDPDPEMAANLVDEAEVVGTVPAVSRLKPSYFHSFAMTENYIVMVENPLVMNVLKLLTSKMRGKAQSSGLEWLKKQKSLFHIIDKRTGKNVNQSHTYYTDPFFVFHHANAYEENGNLIVDVSAYDDGSVVREVDLDYMTNPANLDRLKANPAPYFRRYVIPLNVNGKDGQTLVQKTSHCSATAVLQKGEKVYLTHHLMSQSSMEFPRYNYRFNGKKYRYLFGVSGNPAEFLEQQLIRFDLETGEELRWGAPGYTLCEPAFVASPEAQTEDDGVILSIGISPDPGSNTFLVILDARTMSELARAEVNVVVHKDFHGDFFPDKGFAK